MKQNSQQPPPVYTIGHIPVALLPEDRDPDAPPVEVDKALWERTRPPEVQRWRSVKLAEFRELGNSIAFVEAVAAGIEARQGDGIGGSIESLSTEEELACLRGVCLRLLESVTRSFHNVQKFRPRQGHDLRLVEVMLVKRDNGA